MVCASFSSASSLSRSSWSAACLLIIAVSSARSSSVDKVDDFDWRSIQSCCSFFFSSVFAFSSFSMSMALPPISSAPCPCIPAIFCACSVSCSSIFASSFFQVSPTSRYFSLSLSYSERISFIFLFCSQIF